MKKKGSEEFWENFAQQDMLVPQLDLNQGIILNCLKYKNLCLCKFQKGLWVICIYLFENRKKMNIKKITC